MKKTLLSAAVVAMMALPALAQNDGPVKINGSLIDWYYYGKDIHSNTIGWHQQTPGNGAWIDSLGVGHSTGAANYGLFSLTLSGQTAKPLLPEFLIRNTVLYSNCSGLYMGGNEYYSFYGHEVDAAANIDTEYGSEEYEILVRKWTWDGVDQQTGLYQNVAYEQVGKLYNQPTDLAYDPMNDIVYGVFSIGGADGYKLGTLDMETFSITWISREAMPLTGELRTLACNSKGQLFGTDKSGNIYSVSTTDGTLTKIGEMGFQSQERMMSATVDYRTDKMYWLGFTNNGKNSNSTDGTNTTLSVADGGRDTGLYEIDTNTGEAKLIGMTNFVDVELIYDDNGELVDAKTNKYGKMQMTGIYVEGSIVKHDFDLKAMFKDYPAQLTAGQTATVTTNVKNLGLKTVRGRNYSVSLYAGEQLIATIDDNGEDVYTENLKAGQSQDYTFSYTAPATSGEYTLRLVVTFDSDERTDNNTAQATVKILSHEVLPSPALEGGQTDSSVTLSWEDPKGKVVEDAESYVAFSYDGLGAWTMYDGDKGFTQKANNWNASIEYANWNTPKAFIVMDPVKAGFDLAVGGEKFYAHSGNQYFAAWWTAVPDDSEEGGRQVANDDWMISPRLNGEQQTISFWAKGYKGAEAPGYVSEMDHVELMRVLATEADYPSATIPDASAATIPDASASGSSATIPDASASGPSAWTVVTDTFRVDNAAWTQYTADLPANTRHFALQCCSQEGFVTMIDDIAFTVEAKTVTGYNVYRNGQLIASLPATTTTYTDALSPDAQQPSPLLYTVTAVYEQGESSPSNVYDASAKGLKGDVNGDNTVDVADIAAVIDIMSSGATIPDTSAAGRADVNGDGAVDVADIATIIDIMAQ